MAREVTHRARGPLRVDADDIDDAHGDVAICRCGLSGDRPFCDGSHRVTEDEVDGLLYKYDDDDPTGERRVIAEVVYAGEP